MPPFPPGQTLIRTVHLPANGTDALSARLRLENILQHADLQPAGLPPAALLVVRHLEDRTLAKLVRQADFSTLRRPIAWEQAARATLGSLAAGAARPLAAPVPGNAEAVLFNSPAEMLACLWLDWLADRLGEHWWWRSLYPQAGWPGSSEKLILAASLETIGDIPAAMEILATRGAGASSPLIPWARRLDENTARQMVEAVLTHFGLPALRAARQTPQPAAPPAYFPTERPAHPYISAVPESVVTDLPPATQDLIGITLLLRRAPGLIRSEAFAQRLARWQAAGRPEPEPAPPHVTVHNAPTGENAASPTPETFHPSKGRQAQGPSAAPQISLPAAAISNPLPAKNAQSLEGIFPETADAGLRIVSAVGGLFYLLNLALALGIYNDFTHPADPGWELSPWDFLSLLGREWLGEPLADDPLWPLFARLSGRAEGVPPGAGFTPPAGWQLDGETPGSDWLAWLSAKLRARWALAVGGPEIAAYLMQPAILLVSSSRLDVYFSLDQHPIELRLAGLDRDPGWVPAAGMAIYYHYES
jgi:hypothetical protein